MMHPDAELRFINDAVGYGLFARKPISRGTITWTGDSLDQHFTEDDVNAMDPVCREKVFWFAYMNRKGLYVLCWDHGRYVNHSCDANCLSAGFDFEFAIRDIEAGEQICDDYGLLNLREDLPCLCGAAKCRGTIGPACAVQDADRWDDLVRRAFPCIALVDQPLWPLLDEKTKVEGVLRGDLPLPSCREHFLEA